MLPWNTPHKNLFLRCLQSKSKVSIKESTSNDKKFRDIDNIYNIYAGILVAFSTVSIALSFYRSCLDNNVCLLTFVCV